MSAPKFTPGAGPKNSYIPPKKNLQNILLTPKQALGIVAINPAKMLVKKERVKQMKQNPNLYGADLYYVHAGQATTYILAENPEQAADSARPILNAILRDHVDIDMIDMIVEDRDGRERSFEL